MWVMRPYDFMRECAHEFGDLFTLRIRAESTYVIVSRPDAIRAIFTARADTLGVGAGNAVLVPFVGPASLLLLEGERHVRERRLLMPAFHQKVIAGYGDAIRDALTDAIEDWAPGKTFVAQEVLQGVSIDVILRAVFGVRTKSACADLKRELVSFLNDRRFSLGQMDQLSGGDESLRVFRERLGRIGDLTLAFVADRRYASTAPDDSPGDILSMLLHAKDEFGHGPTDSELRDELLTLVATGYETTATALAWGLYWIAGSREVRTRLRAEVAAVGDADARAYSALPYLDAVVKETLRVYPIVPFVFREALQPFNLDGYTFDRGTILAPSVYLTHRREDLYDRPEMFEPERFLARTYSPYEYLPFGGGARRCIGMNLAIYEMKVILATLFQRFDLENDAGTPVLPVRRSVAMAPSGGGRMIVRHAYG